MVSNTSATSSTAFDRGTDAIIGLISDEQAKKLLDFSGDEDLSRRIEELAAKCNEGELNDKERAEYEGYVRANKFVAILQAQVRRLFTMHKS